MSNKRYYWLKLKEDFFEEDTIAWLEEQENGKDYALFYLKLCLKSLKTNGLLIRSVGNILVPYDVKKLAEITNTDYDTALVAMELLKKIGLVEILDTGEIYLTKLHEMVGSETNKAISMRRLREQRKTEELPEGNIVTELLPECSESVAPEHREEEKDIEIEKEKRKSINYQAIVDAYNEICISFPRCTKLTDKRKSAIRARLSNGYTTDDFTTAFEKAQASSFLKGEGGRGWKMPSIDWLLNETNLVKVLEGSYDNKKKSTDKYSVNKDYSCGFEYE